MEAWVTVELLPLDPLELLVEAVREVRVEIIDGEVSLVLEAAMTSR